MSSRDGSPNRHAIDFPDGLPAGAHVDVPKPLENHPDWTVVPFSYADMPPMFDDLIRVPDYETHPAFYAAAVDTIRMTNTYFKLTGSYSSERSREFPLTRDICLEKQQEWAEIADESGPDDWLAAIARIPDPPDLRTLLVKVDMGDPTDDSLETLWLRAFREVKSMSELTWKIYLGYTRQQLIDQANARNPNDDAWLILEIFKRYLVWNELWEGVSNRALRFEEKQPTWTELRDFFNREDVKKEGVTLVDICHAFPRAIDAEMLVYRIEHFAVLEKQPPQPMDAGIEDPVESRYMPRSPPSSQHIRESALNLLKGKGSSASLKELAGLYLPSRVQDRLIKDVLTDLGARLDTANGRFSLHGNEPSPQGVRSVVQHEVPWYLNGITLQEAARPFQSQARDREDLFHRISRLYFFDETEKLYFPLQKDKKYGGRLSVERSLVARNEARIRMALGQGNLVWDRRLSTYVPRAHGRHLGTIGGARGLSPDHGSPTDTVADTIAGGTPPSEPMNTLGRITAWEIEPISPRSRSSTSVAPAMRTSAEARPSPSVEEPAAGTSSPVAEPDTSGQGKKRELPEEGLQSSTGKRARKNPKIRCFRKTLKQTRCKRQKDRDGEENEWECGAHKQS